MKLFHRQFSSAGPPLVILHGVYGNQGNWAAQARQLANRFAVYGIDARNHGQSPWAQTMRYDDMAADVAETLDALGLERVFLMGHSMGGKTAMLLALQHPARVAKLVVVDIAPVDYAKASDDVLPAALALPLEGLQSRAAADAWLATRLSDKGVRDFLLTNLTRDGEGRFGWRINLPVIRDHFRTLTGWPEGTGRYEGPALFIRGALSRYVLPEYEAAVYAQFPAAEIETVTGAGHWVHSEKPEAVQRLIRDFLLA